MSRAEYMREYRKKRKAGQPAPDRDKVAYAVELLDKRAAQIRDLEDEVRRLKRLLAERAPVIPKAVGEGLGRSLSQTERDAILRRVQTKPDRR